MSESNQEFALGTSTYTLGDVFLTNFLTRTCADQSWYKKEVLGNAVMKAYWERVQKRPSYKTAP